MTISITLQYWLKLSFSQLREKDSEINMAWNILNLVGGIVFMHFKERE